MFAFKLYSLKKGLSYTLLNEMSEASVASADALTLLAKYIHFPRW